MPPQIAFLPRIVLPRTGQPPHHVLVASRLLDNRTNREVLSAIHVDLIFHLSLFAVECRYTAEIKRRLSSIRSMESQEISLCSDNKAFDEWSVNESTRLLFDSSHTGIVN